MTSSQPRLCLSHGPLRSVHSSCTAHGWHGDEPIDAVDESCMRHDLAYCACEAALRERAVDGYKPPKALSVLAALRSTGFTAPVLADLGVDRDYLACVHVADTGLISDGLRVRAESQRSACSGAAYDAPRWFCDLRSLTLARVEQVDFDLFLSALDWDAKEEAARGSQVAAHGSSPPTSKRIGATPVAQAGEPKVLEYAVPADAGTKPTKRSELSLLALERQRRQVMMAFAGQPEQLAGAAEGVARLEDAMRAGLGAAQAQGQ